MGSMLSGTKCGKLVRKRECIVNMKLEAVGPIILIVVNCFKSSRRGGRVAECGGLLNRCTG